MDETAAHSPTAGVRDVEPEASIRTMQQDVSAAMKSGGTVPATAKPAPLPPPPAPTPLPRLSRVTLSILALGLAGVAGAAIFVWVSRLKPPPPAPPPPILFIFFEETRQATITPAASALRRALESRGTSEWPIGSFERLIVQVRNEAGLPGVIDSKALFALLGIAAPDEFFAPLKDPPQFFTYAQAEGLRPGIMMPTEDPIATFRDLVALEPTLGNHLGALGIGELPSADYRLAAYRNIEYRYLALDPEFDIGFGYFAFPGRRLVVLATSEEAIRSTITRLYESR